MVHRTRIHVAFHIFMGSVWGACAPEPSLGDPYADNGYFWPYGDPESADGALEDEEPACPDGWADPLGELPDGSPVVPLSTCDPSPEGDFDLCASFGESGELQANWRGANGFALFVTEPQAVIPSAPNTPVSEGETFWSIGPVGFPTDGFASPLVYGQMPDGMKDVTTDHGGPDGGTDLDAGRCYKLTVLNTAFLRASVNVGWE